MNINFNNYIKYANNKKINVFIFISLLILNLSYLLINVLYDPNISDRATDYYNAFLLSKGYILNQDFQTVFPGGVFFYAFFFKIFPDINFIGLRIVALIYTIVTIAAVYIFIKTITQHLKLNLNSLFIINILLLFVPIYVHNELDLFYNNMPILIFALIFILYLSENSLSNIFIGFFIGILILIKETFVLLIPLTFIYNFLTKSFNKKTFIYFFLGLSVPLFLFLLYLLLNNSFFSTIEVYRLHADQDNYENEVFSIIKNFIIIIPGTLLIFSAFKFFAEKKYNYLALLFLFFSYYLFIRYSNLVIFYRSYFIGTIYTGILLYLITEIKNVDEIKKIKYLLIAILILTTVVIPLGSRNLALALTEPAFIIIPLIIFLMIYLKRLRLLFLVCFPVLIFLTIFQAKSRGYEFVWHQIILKDSTFNKYHINKLANMYGYKEDVNELSDVYNKIDSYVSKNDYILIYPRYPFLYFLALPAMPKVDLETGYSTKWVTNNFNYMLKKNHIPKYIISEREFENQKFYKIITNFLSGRYYLLEKVGRFNIYKLKH